MMSSDFIIDVTEEDFEFEVLSYSQNIPVVVDFWAEWCRPCKQLSPMLEAMAKDALGSFRLAKVDVDHSPNLALHYNVRSVPTVKAFSGGQVVAEFVGLPSVERVTEFISKLAPPSSLNLSIEKGLGYLGMHQWDQAEDAFRDVLDEAPENPQALLGLSKTLLAKGEAHEANYILKNFPTSPLYNKSELLRPLAEAITNLKDDSLPDETDLDAAFQNSIRLASRGNFLAALDGLLDLLREDRRYRSDKARQVILGLLEIMGEDDPDTRTYRSELANILF